MSNSRLISIVFLAFLLAPLFVVPSISFVSESSMVSATNSSSATAFSLIPPPQIPRTVRVAIYVEPNTTLPSYITHSPSIDPSHGEMATILSTGPFTVTMLDVHDIYNHQLMTASYDVLILPDNVPRENITNQVLEFWLGGGAILALDTAASFLCYFGILPPESATSDGFGVYWNYVASSANISARHPVSKAYSVADQFNTPTLNYATWDWAALGTSVIATDLIHIGQYLNSPNDVTILGFDPTDRGGKVVHLWWDGFTDPLPAMHQMIRDACDWLCTRPTGRIVFDLSHLPRRSIDPWDTPYSMYPGSYKEMRNEWVRHGFLVDKLYPAASGDNFTLARLAPYDLLVVNVPDYNYTTGDRTAFQTWANNGGSILAFGDYPDPIWFRKQNYQTSMLLSPFGLTMNDTAAVGASYTSTTFTMHPITEGCTSHFFDAFGYVNVSGSATGVWYDGPNIILATSTYGSGRAVLIADINAYQDGASINSANNKQSVLNLANWLSSTSARVLLYTDEIYSPNYYRTSVALALNDLGINFYLTGGFALPFYDYFNFSLYQYTWDLVIVDNANQFNLVNYYDDLVNYLDLGGSMIFTSFDVDVGAGHRLLNRLGVAHASSVGGEPAVHIWDSAHHIFTMPHSFTNANFTSTMGYTDDGDKFTTFANATALAGATPALTAGEGFIIVRNDGKTLLNGYLIDNFQTDEDDSTYEDRLELWINEIAFMMAPRCVFTPNIPASHIQGLPLTFTVDIINNGFTPAIGGELTVSIPAALGTLSDPATQPFTLDPGASTTITWHSSAIGVGNHTITFDGTYHGVPATTYHSGTITRYLNITPGIPIALPWWWPIAAIAVIVIIVVVILVICLRRRKSSK